MTRVAIIADSHFCEDSRFEETVRVHGWIAGEIARRKVDLILHAGDVYDRRSTERERMAVASWVQRCAEIAPVVIARGNHDRLGDLPLLERLETVHPIKVYETCGVMHANGCNVAVMAWPQRSNLHAMVGTDGGREAVELAAGDALRAVLRGLGEQLDVMEAGFSGPRILLSHAMIRASRVSTGQPLVGCDFEIGIEDLALARADFYALGHVHFGQDWRIGNAPAVYPGSPRRTAFGEVEPKGFVIAEFDGQNFSFERVETPCAPMVLLEGEWKRSSGLSLTGMEHWVTLETLRGAEVRIRYEVATDDREAARGDAESEAERFRKLGAVNVKIDEIVQAETRARAPEFAKALPIGEKMELLWRARGFDPGPRREALIAKIHQIEGEVG